MLDAVLAFFAEQWKLIILIATWAGILIGWYRRRRSWRDRHFARLVNLSLNHVVDGRLQFRTLLEESADRVWLNDYGIGRVLEAARQATADDPFLRLDDAEEMNMVNRAVLNVLSEHFAQAHLAVSLGLPVRLADYVFGITHERYGQLRTHKLRVMVIREDLLARFAPGSADPVEPPNQQIHRDRHQTLQVMAALWQAPVGRARLGKLELGIGPVWLAPSEPAARTAGGPAAGPGGEAAAG